MNGVSSVYKLISKLFISGMLDKMAADNLAKNWLISKFKRDLRMSHQQMPQFCGRTVSAHAFLSCSRLTAGTMHRGQTGGFGGENNRGNSRGLLFP